jgi:hypothetical protein
MTKRSADCANEFVGQHTSLSHARPSTLIRTIRSDAFQSSNLRYRCHAENPRKDRFFAFEAISHKDWRIFAVGLVGLAEKEIALLHSIDGAIGTDFN